MHQKRVPADTIWRYDFRYDLGVAPLTRYTFCDLPNAPRHTPAFPATLVPRPWPHPPTPPMTTPPPPPDPTPSPAQPTPARLRPLTLASLNCAALARLLCARSWSRQKMRMGMRSLPLGTNTRHPNVVSCKQIEKRICRFYRLSRCNEKHICQLYRLSRCIYRLY